jgi:hypothetical protein
LDRFSQIEPRTIEWLWPGRLALGKLAILDGDPGLGKSLITLDLCARLSTGRPFADGNAGSSPASAVVLNGEDGAADTIRPRLEALGADLERVYVLHRKSETAMGIRFPKNAGELRAAVRESRARLVVIDPIMAFLDESVNTGNDQSVRRALLPLMNLAEEEHCAVLLVRHLNKGAGFHSIYRGGGSIGFVGACRSGWLVVREPFEARTCVLAQVKGNLAGPQPSLGYTVQAGPDGRLTLTWLGENRWSADQLLAAARRAPDAFSPRERAGAFLKEVLKNGPRTSRDIWNLGVGKRLSKRTLQRARRDLRIRTVLVHENGRRSSYWLLLGQKLPGHLAEQDLAEDIEKYMGPLRERFPPPTPLDEI